MHQASDAMQHDEVNAERLPGYPATSGSARAVLIRAEVL